MKSMIYIFICILFFTTAGFAQIFVAPDGNDENPGTIGEPLESLQQAQSLASPGDTVYIRGGLYEVRQDQISTVQQNLFACITFLDKSGLPGQTIKYWAYPGETPVFDFSGVKPADQRVVGIWMAGEYIHLKGFEMTGIQVTITGHTESYCIYSRGNNNIFEQISMHDNVGTGLRHYRGGGNLFLNCDAYRNHDYVSQDGTGSNNDGFGCHPDSGSTGNVFKGCRAWFNSDDGFDIIRADEGVVFDSCWAFYNGYSTSFSSLGDGNGFKAGGYAHDTEENLPAVIPRNIIRFCIAVCNKANGFYANHHLGGNDWYNNSGFRNGARDFNMLNRPTREDAENIDGPGYGHVLINNLAGAQFGDGTANIDDSLNTQEKNTWMLGIRVVSDDFISTEMDQLTAPRNADGSLPDIDFLRPAFGSAIIDAGVDIGFDFLGDAPDIGAKEFDYTTDIEDIKKNIPAEIKLFQNYPNPFNAQTNFEFSVRAYSNTPLHVNLSIYNPLGQKLATLVNRELQTGKYTIAYDAENLPSGIYYYTLQQGNQVRNKKMLLIK